jgi:uncharacterized protein YfaP (DUF2135 family)
MSNSIWKNKFLLSKNLMPKQLKFTLEWSKEPRDLDLHLKFGSEHIYYGNKRSGRSRANLDRDDVTSHGPETITINKVQKSQTYKIYVNVYAPSSQRINGKNWATLSVYRDRKLDRVVKIEAENLRKVDILKVVKGRIEYLYR